MGEAKRQQWYLRFHGDAVGPFPPWQIARYLLLHRLGPEDEISRDKSRWYPIRQVPEVLPENRLKAVAISEEERQCLEQTRDWVEEHPSLFIPLDEAHGVEDELLAQDEVYHPRLAAKSPPRSLFGYALAVVLAIAVVATAFLLPQGKGPALPQCGASPAPGVNWSNCLKQGQRLENQDLSGARLRSTNLAASVLRAANLAGADLAYSNLSGSNLRGANLSGARLTGADLRNSELQSANLSEADLSYANLTGANLADAHLQGTRLGNAIMGEETICMPESLGRCIRAKR